MAVDQQLLKKARRRRRPFTAKDVGLSSADLRKAGAVEVDRVRTGHRGRPAILFSWGSGEGTATNGSD